MLHLAIEITPIASCGESQLSETWNPVIWNNSRGLVRLIAEEPVAETSGIA